jgi:hypothetical protein
MFLDAISRPFIPSFEALAGFRNVPYQKSEASGFEITMLAGCPRSNGEMRVGRRSLIAEAKLVRIG